ncbi:MBL fold metallo-hydrolase [Lachnospiraceae bacterium 42-17]|jgi:competence protein ComEC
MGVIHFLNVKEGDCIWVEHPSGHNTVIDVSNAEKTAKILESVFATGNHNQKNHPVNPIEYLSDREVSTIFRFILTHPDMDHMDGIKDLFSSFDIINFWDTENTKVMGENVSWGRYKKEDWDFYQKIRNLEESPKVLHLYAGSHGKYYNQDENGESGADGLYLLAPTSELVEEANRTEEYNDCSYVILYRTGNHKKIIFAGDSAENTWDYILENFKDDVTDVDVLVAPHHGRKTGGNDAYLDTLKPKLTLFGNAKSQYLDYASWINRELDHITNNQANCIVLDTNGSNGIDVYVTYETFARKRNSNTFFEEKYNAWYIMTI